MKEKKKMSLLAKQSAAGWVFLTPATILIAIMAFWPMVQAFIMSLQTGSSANLQWNDPIFNNYTRMFSDKVFMTSVGNTFLYLIIQVPIMLVLAILLAQLLNNQHLRFKGFFRTCVFLPCATALVSYALIFKSLFATDGLINAILVNLGILEQNYNFLGHPTSAKAVLITEPVHDRRVRIMAGPNRVDIVLLHHSQVFAQFFFGYISSCDGTEFMPVYPLKHDPLSVQHHKILFHLKPAETDFLRK